MKQQYGFSTGKQGAIAPILQGKTQVNLYLIMKLSTGFEKRSTPKMAVTTQP
jgi:hypothetical protein